MFTNKIFNSSYFFRFVFSANVLLVSSSVFSEDLMTDSVHGKKLHEVIVKGQTHHDARSAMPLQSRTQKDFLSLNAMNVADITNSFSGVTLKDYGGIGGQKTVSVRGMDAHYTGVSYDGVMMSDIQSGHIDLGRFPLDNITEISLANGQVSDIFQSARVFAYGSVLCLKTMVPELSQNDWLNGKIYFKGGSFGMLNPGFFLKKNLDKKVTLNASLDAMSANGEYSFIQYYGPRQTSKSEVLKRTNTDVHSIRTELNGLYRFNEKEYISLKANAFFSNRGLPGSVTYYNHDESKQRLTDKTIFTQLHYQNRASKLFQYQLFARYNHAYCNYTDQDAKYSQTQGLLDNKFWQSEYYTSVSVQYKPFDNLLLSGASDWWCNQLDIRSNIEFQNFPFPTRHTGMSNIAIRYFTDKVVLSSNLLYTSTNEFTKSGIPSPDRNRFSPTLNASYKLTAEKEYRIRAFYKNIFRLPTFNDLYYTHLGNPNLRPEDANLFNVGFTGVEPTLGIFSMLDFTADMYFNRVKDKIIALPVDGFRWSMTNRGLVKIFGSDISLKGQCIIGKNSAIRFRGNYSFQSAKDATPASDTYGEQIPYTPMHFGSGSLSFQHGKWEAGYNFLFSGERWIGQMIDPRKNRLDPYMTHSLFGSLQYKKCQISGEIINMLNSQYEVVKFYPMPRRNMRISLIYNLN